jgi:hypothetical protein
LKWLWWPSLFKPSVAPEQATAYFLADTPGKVAFGYILDVAAGKLHKLYMGLALFVCEYHPVCRKACHGDSSRSFCEHSLLWIVLKDKAYRREKPVFS